MIAGLDAWFDRVAGAVHAFGGEVLKFIGDGVLAIFPVTTAPLVPLGEHMLRGIAAPCTVFTREGLDGGCTS
jgi:class 3 adenylate cyclase